MYASIKWILDEYNSIPENSTPVNSIADFIVQLKKNNKSAGLLISKYIGYLLTGINNIILAVNPDTIVLGGEIKMLLPFVLPPIQNYFKTHRFFNVNLGYKIVGSRMNNDASALGAAIIPFFSFIKDYSLGK